MFIFHVVQAAVGMPAAPRQSSRRPVVQDMIASHIEDCDPPTSASNHVCDGPCCEPLARNRSCHFRSLHFRRKPDRAGNYLRYLIHKDEGAPVVDAASFRTVKRSFYFSVDYRRASGPIGAPYGHDAPPFKGLFFEPSVAPVSSARNVTRCLRLPVYIGSMLHWNFGHALFDLIFPAFVALARLRASSASSKQSLPDPAGGAPFVFLESEPSLSAFGARRDGGYGRYERSRVLAESLSGVLIGVGDLVAACPRGCMLDHVVVGAGHVGLMTPDENNQMGGARVARALFALRSRFYKRFHVAPALPSTPPARPLVAFVRSKRNVSNLAAVIDAVSMAMGGRAAVDGIAWEGMSLVEQIRYVSKVAVYACGVGTAMFNSFLLPAGAVVMALGWRMQTARKRIAFYDQYFINALDHVRVLYYPSYDEWELEGPRDQLRLDVRKVLPLVQHALDIYTRGFVTPLPYDANSNEWDRAYAELNRRTGMASHRQRTGDEVLRAADGLPNASQSCILAGSSVELMLLSEDAEYGPKHRGGPDVPRGKRSQGASCVWHQHDDVAYRVARAFNLTTASYAPRRRGAGRGARSRPRSIGASPGAGAVRDRQHHVEERTEPRRSWAAVPGAHSANTKPSVWSRLLSCVSTMVRFQGVGATLSSWATCLDYSRNTYLRRLTGVTDAM